jgi:UDP-N-acetylmuramoyl-L-alanyl-D-glutamate--2,6-diaminopimelate ligase
VGDAFGRELARRCVGRRTPVIAVWMRPESVFEPVSVETEIDAGALIETLHADEVKLGLAGLVLEVRGSFGAASIATRLLGRFNAENTLLVLGCLQTLEVPLAEGARALAACRAPPGRMELIEAAAPGKPRAVIDYAHSPDALAKALATLREHCRGALWCVFGCGGDRDRGKRALMGAIADELADRVIVTDDNPRSEPPERIAREIVAGFKVHEPRIIHDRGHAIEIVLAEAAANDWVLIAGKGHEDYQIYGTTRRRFSDRQAALSSLGVAA